MYENLSQSLQVAFSQADEKVYRGRGGGNFKYISSRKVAARLDQVVGAENWKFDWEPVCLVEPMVVKGTIFIRCDGDWVGKSEAGYQNAMPNAEGKGGDLEPIKSAVTDAFRRCGSQWGIARYLYEGLSGTPAPGNNTRTTPAQTQRPAPVSQPGASGQQPQQRPANPVPPAQPKAATPPPNPAPTPVQRQEPPVIEDIPTELVDQLRGITPPSMSGEVDINFDGIDKMERDRMQITWGRVWNHARELQKAGSPIEMPRSVMSGMKDEDLRIALKDLIGEVAGYDPEWTLSLVRTG